jgi:ABC-type multidrug transport system fused ATPase/permease subunit
MLKAYGKIWALLSPRERRQAYALVVAVIGSGMFEAVGVASIVPFLAVIADASMIERNPLLSGLYDFLDPASPEAFLRILGVGVFCIVVCGLMFKIATTSALYRFATRRTYTLSCRLMQGYIAQPYGWFLNRHGADLGKSMLAEVDRVVDETVIPALKCVSQLVVVLFLVLLLIAAEPFVALTAALTLGACYGVIFRLSQSRIRRLGARTFADNGERYRIASEAFGGIKDVKTLGIESVYLERFRQPAERMARSRWFIFTLMDAPRHVLEAIAFGGMLLLVLSMLDSPGSGGLGDVLPLLGLYAFAGIRLFPATQQLFGNFARIRFHQPVLESIWKEIEETRGGRESIEDVSAAAPLHLARTLELRGIRYAYAGASRAALDGLDLNIAARTTVGIVGGTGAGKTTMVDVMLGLLPPQQGEILVDGVSVDDANRRAWRRSIGYVPQQIFLTDETVSANIAFGVAAKDIDQAAVERAARLAKLHDFVAGELPQGYATLVGERGVRLSGGQRQRIGIARALYYDPDILIFDEATSALDNRTERAVMDAVQNLGHAKTIIMIAHRLNTVRGCDVIFMLDRGVVAASGTYDQLIGENAMFQSLAGGAAN